MTLTFDLSSHSHLTTFPVHALAHLAGHCVARSSDHISSAQSATTGLCVCSKLAALHGNGCKDT